MEEINGQSQALFGIDGSMFGFLVRKSGLYQVDASCSNAINSSSWLDEREAFVLSDLILLIHGK